MRENTVSWWSSVGRRNDKVITGYLMPDSNSKPLWFSLMPPACPPFFLTGALRLLSVTLVLDVFSLPHIQTLRELYKLSRTLSKLNLANHRRGKGLLKKSYTNRLSKSYTNTEKQKKSLCRIGSAIQTNL